MFSLTWEWHTLYNLAPRLVEVSRLVEVPHASDGVEVVVRSLPGQAVAWFPGPAPGHGRQMTGV